MRQRLHRFMADLGYDQATLSRASGVPVNTVWRYYKGESGLKKGVFELAPYLGRRVEEFTQDAEPGPPNRKLIPAPSPVRLSTIKEVTEGMSPARVAELEEAARRLTEAFAQSARTGAPFPMVEISDVHAEPKPMKKPRR